MRQLSLDEDEFKVFFDDVVYSRNPYYQQRTCETCFNNRPPKSTHCKTCNRCVNGFDHHCVALNNCVGRRNIRTFYTFLVASTCFATMTSVVSLM